MKRVPKKDGIILGIDPGKSGFCAFMTPTGRICAVEPFPFIGKGKAATADWLTLKSWIEKGHPDFQHLGGVTVVGSEWFRPMPRNGKLTWWSLGSQLEGIRVCALLLGARLHFIPPKDWQNICLRGRPKDGRDQIKASSQAVSCELWPGFAPLFKKKDGAADAALIAEYVRRVL